MAHYDKWNVEEDSFSVSVKSPDGRGWCVAEAATRKDTYNVDNLRAALHKFCDLVAERQRTDRKTYEQFDGGATANFYTQDGEPEARINTNNGAVTLDYQVLLKMADDAKRHFEASDD